MAADDTLSHSGLTSVSDTDHIMFTVLSNVERVDLSSLPRAPIMPDTRIEELPNIPEEAPARPASPVEAK